MNSSAPARVRVLRSCTVLRTEQLTPHMVRVILTGDELRQLPDLTFTDHYLKLLFAPAGADYEWPFDPEAVKAERPSTFWPVTRTYTIRWFDREANELAIDFVVHGDDGLAGPWAARAQPGDGLGFYGPGGAFTPDETADAHLLIGDEAALPAIAAALEVLPHNASAMVFIEVADAEHEQTIASRAAVDISWVHRDASGLAHGEALASAVLAAELPTGRLDAFVHGNAEMVKALRRYLLIDRGIPRSQVSISGYWRTGHTEDGWQATKREFTAAMEREQPLPVTTAP